MYTTTRRRRTTTTTYNTTTSSTTFTSFPDYTETSAETSTQSKSITITTASSSLSTVRSTVISSSIIPPTVPPSKTTSVLFTTRLSTPPTPWNRTTTKPMQSPSTTNIPASQPTTLPIVNVPNTSYALWIALSGVFIVLFILASAVALYIYVSGVEINNALGSIGHFFTCRKSNRPANDNDPYGTMQPNNFDPFDAYYNQQLQQQLKNKLRPKHNSISSISNNSSKAIRQKYPKFNVDPYRQATMEETANESPVEAPHFELMDDIDVIKYKNRLNKL
uniref:Uncharacterized protein n=1 Tax=Anopheles christyi TaxID=43041 RepID=A0A182KIY8_9DIPT